MDLSRWYEQLAAIKKYLLMIDPILVVVFRITDNSGFDIKYTLFIISHQRIISLDLLLFSSKYKYYMYDTDE